MTYNEVQNIIGRYASEMAPYFADHWSRFPRGGTAAMIVNYLQERCNFYYDAGIPEVSKQLSDAAAEIIAREGRP
jgi:hypothetical protein